MRKLTAVALGVAALNLPAQAQAQAPEPKVYTSFAVVHSLMCLDALHWGTAAGTPIVQYPCHGGANQQWSIQAATDGRFWLQNENSLLCLNSPNGTEGSQLVLGSCSFDQQWELAVDRAGLLLRSAYSGMCADVFDFSQTNKAPVVQWRCNIGFTNQQWVIR